MYRLSFREGGFLAAAQTFEGIGFAQPVIGIVRTQVDGFVGRAQGLVVAAQAMQDERFIVPGGGQARVVLEGAFVREPGFSLVFEVIKGVAPAIPG